MDLRLFCTRALFACALVAALCASPATATDYRFWDTGGIWNNSLNWSPNGVPGSGDTASVGDIQDSYCEVKTWQTCDGLDLFDGGDLYCWEDGLLVVNGTTTVTNSPTHTTSVYVYRGTLYDRDFDTDVLDLDSDAHLYMHGGIVEIDDQLDVDTTSQIRGYGDIRLNGANTRAFHLAGELSVANGDLTLQDMSGSAGLDLDGSSGGDSVIDVTSGYSRLDVDGHLADSFSGTMTVGDGNTVDFSQAWECDGTLDLQGTSTQHATLSGAPVIVSGDLNVTGVVDIAADATFKNTANVSVASLGRLNLLSDTVFKGGSHTGDGMISCEGAVTIESNTTIGTAVLNWDGTGSTTTTIDPGVTFTINSEKIDSSAPSTDGFDGTVNVGSNGQLAVNTTDPWRMEGTMNMDGAGGSSYVTGSSMVVADSGSLGGINCTGGSCYINVPVTFESTSRTHVDSTGHLRLWGATTLEGGTHTGDGTLSFYASPTVTDDTTIDTAILNWDGGTPTHTTTVAPGATFTINSSQIDITTSDGFDGTVDVYAGATLEVNTLNPWRMEGRMTLDHSGGAPEVDGSRMVVADSIDTGEGLYASGGACYLRCPVAFESTAVVDVGAGAVLYLYGDTFYSGGSFTGNMIRQEASATVAVDTSIDVTTFDWDGAGDAGEVFTVNPGISCTINSDTIELDPSGGFGDTMVIDSGASLTVNTAAEWQLDGTMTLAGGSVSGQDIDNRGTIEGNGSVQADVANNSLIAADSGGTLSLAGKADLDGDDPDGTGEVEALNGDVHALWQYGSAFAFDGTLRVGNGHEFRMDYDGLANLGQVDLSGGTFAGPAFLHRGQLNVTTATSTLESSTIEFDATSDTDLGADLELDGTATVENGARFTGSGTLIVLPGSTLDGEGGIGVDVRNEGTVSPGASPGLFDMAGDYTQAAGATLKMGLAGTDPLQYDRLTVVNLAQLDGNLALMVETPYAPAFGDAFTLITSGSLSGTFSTVDGVIIDSGDKALAVTYDTGADEVVCEVALPGDATLDTNVDVSDLSVMGVNYGTTSGAVWEKGDFNGDGAVDISDLSVLGTNYGRSYSLSVPEPATLALLGLGGIAAITRRRR
jgi:hypothetical protein